MAYQNSDCWFLRDTPIYITFIRFIRWGCCLILRPTSDQELAKAEQTEAKIEIYESLLLDCKDALQVLRDELLEDPEFRNRQQTGEGKVSTQHFLYTYIQVLSVNCWNLT